MTACRRFLIHLRRIPVLLCLLLTAAPGLALDVPQLKGRVNDYAAILAPATVAQLENSLSIFEQEQSTQIVVLTVTSLEGDSLEDFSLRVAEKWQPGQKDRDNGALLLIAKNDRKIRIEVGYGLEGALTDLVAGRIIRDVITPQFRNGNFDQGVINGTAAMMAAVKGEFTADQPQGSAGSPNNDPGGLIVPLLIGMFFIGRVFGRHKILTAAIGSVAAPLLGLFALGPQWLIILALIPIGFIAGLVLATLATAAGAGRSGGPWISSGGGFGGSSGGFSGGFGGGGGGFGGGGASGGW